MILFIHFYINLLKKYIYIYIIFKCENLLKMVKKKLYLTI